LKFSVRFGRTVRTANFESLKIEMEQECDDDYISREDALEHIRGVVLEAIGKELAKLGVNRS